MRRLVLLAIAASLAGARAGAQEKGEEPPLTIAVDPRVELLSIIFRLAGNPEYGQGRVASYVADVESHFGRHRDHAVVETARRLRRQRGVSFDAVMSMAVHLEDASSLAEAVPFDPRPPELDERWTVADARLFLDKARRFVREADFAAFFESHRALYDTAVARAKALIEKDGHLEWFRDFFGARPGASFTLALGMLNGGACYGPRVRKGKTEILYCVLGVWKTDEEGLPAFDRGMLGTVAHEFCHSYVNPLVYENEEDLRKPGETIYPLVAEEMRRQAYANWQTMMCESLVRACVVRYVRATQGAGAAEDEAREQVARHFHWTPELAELLGEYEASRERYPGLGTFMPRIVSFFRDYAPGFARERERLDAGRPRVVSMIPANGATDVDPDLRAIVITFDREMGAGYSFVGGGPHYPETTGRPSYDERKRVITLPVKLKPDWSYEFWLNRGRYDGFRSAEGAPLEPVRVTFKTRAR